MYYLLNYFFLPEWSCGNSPSEELRVVNCEWYTTIYLPKMLGKIKKTNKRCQIILHQDNACSHISHETIEVSAFKTLLQHSKHCFHGSSPKQYRFGTQGLLFPVRREWNTWTTISVGRRSCWPVHEFIRNVLEIMTNDSNTLNSLKIVKKNVLNKYKVIFNDNYCFFIIRIKM